MTTAPKEAHMGMKMMILVRQLLDETPPPEHSIAAIEDDADVTEWGEWARKSDEDAPTRWSEKKS